jgi:outer membrane protein
MAVLALIVSALPAVAAQAPAVSFAPDLQVGRDDPQVGRDDPRVGRDDPQVGRTLASLTLDDAIARGLANSQRVAELEARSAAASAIEDGRAAGRQPIVSLAGGYTRTNHVTEFAIALPGAPLQVIYPDIPDNYRSRLDVQWPIYTAGRVDALERAARAEREATGEDLAAARADLRLEITRAFWALVTARESEQVVNRSLDSIDAHVRDLRSRLAQGFIPPNDVLSAEAQQSRQRLLAIEAGNLRGISEAELLRLLGADAPERIEPAATLAPPGATNAGEVEALVAQARGQRPERRALEDRAAAARERIAVAQSESRPQVAVTGGYDYSRPNPRIFPRSTRWEDSWDVSVNASWSIWDGGRSRADRAEAAATARAAESRVLELDRQITFEVRQRRLEVDSSRAAIPTAADGVRAAAEAFRVVGERFRAGVATNTDVLDAESALLQAELDQTRALANARLADARLARAVGQ